MHANLIGGEWVGSSDATRNINPSDVSDLVGEYGRADAVQVKTAVAAAKDAFRGWSRSTPQVRADVLDKAGSEILARRAELGDLLAREEGKTLAEATGEVTRAGHIFKYFSGEALRPSGEYVQSVRPDVEVEVTREPVGVIGILTPWNFPIAIPSWKIAPALAFGNCVVFKPADLVPGSSWALADILSRSGLPPGVFNLVMGRGTVVGEAIVNHPDIPAVSFTGSVATGRGILEACARRAAKVQLELGGKNPLVVLADADLDIAVRAALDGAFFSTGQRCTASSRLIVETGIHDRFVEALTRAMQQQVVDDARKSGTTIGPVVDQKQFQQNLDYIEIGKREGARLVAGGETLKRDKSGFYMSPALFVDTRADQRINREEIFGPVAAVTRVSGYEEALASANATPFGLCSGICTTSLKFARHFQRNAEAGMVMVNLATAGVDYHVPFGGRKDSSYGPKEQGFAAREFFTQSKTSYIKS
ncbi:MAG TPA: aldehyde dehydrogenase family protein [Steroidobacteraceae bacterium]|jgi:aldehyde dehydrogenase (NAD+)|nr:aldehyde dehydrogenase family protein [Steroidobacteraceae bacterium]